ncbi:hypothetical protein QBC47DRAFT_370781 [Echria macrotheca]|uniref:Uncharacterized protein n=1 Tax=Echria macrotheca TaxID=438768 RepID=A0AAJ0BKS0_9PEZI|nr:hypothetical protein QBC47DRAFT_370781 [Echria macrotheca]
MLQTQRHYFILLPTGWRLDGVAPFLPLYVDSPPYSVLLAFSFLISFLFAFLFL